MKRIVIRLIRFYQKVTVALVAVRFPLVAWAGCRSWPTCSEYTIDAIRTHGTVRGSYKGMVRILHCNPCLPHSSISHS